MRAANVIRSLGPIDLKSIGRDPLLRWMIGIPLVFALLARWVVPYAAERVSVLIDFDLSPYYRPMLAMYLLMMVPGLAGWVIGFLLLDQRDDGTLTALRVTPLTLRGYLAWRLLAPTVVSFVLTLPLLPLSGMMLEGGMAAVVPAALVSAPLAPIGALCLGCFAANKVQGIALMKASGIFMLPPFVAYFAPAIWHVPLAIAPTYWAPAVYWNAAAGSPFWPFVLGGLIYEALVLVWLVRRYERSLAR